jgi:hypothetical protein
MPTKIADVDSYVRRTKSGKTVQVHKYFQKREAGDYLKKPGRPPMTATPGQFPQGRMIPGPEAAKHAKRQRAAELKATQNPAQLQVEPHDELAQLEKQIAELTKRRDELRGQVGVGKKDVSEAVKTAEAHGLEVVGHKVKEPPPPKPGEAKKPTAKKAAAPKSSTFTHSTGSKHEVPAGGEVRTHKASPDSHLILDAQGTPVTFIGKNGKATKPPTHAVKAKDTNYKKVDHGSTSTSGQEGGSPSGQGAPGKAAGARVSTTTTSTRPCARARTRPASSTRLSWTPHSRGRRRRSPSSSTAV